MVTSTRASATLAASPLIWALECVRLPGPRGPEPFRPYTYQATLLADRKPRQLILKSRQVGVTTVAAIRVLHEAIHAPRSLSLVISRDLVAAQNVVRLVLDIVGGLDAPPRLVKENQSELVFENGSRIISQPATERSGRGYTATSVTLDEFAFCEYDERIYRAVSPTLSRGGRLTVLSTPNGQANLFYQLWQGIEGGDWSRHKIHWKECPAFGDAWYERERPRYTSEQWASEFDLDFVASGGAAFDPNDIDAMKSGWNGLKPPAGATSAVGTLAGGVTPPWGSPWTLRSCPIRLWRLPGWSGRSTRRAPPQSTLRRASTARPRWKATASAMR